MSYEFGKIKRAIFNGEDFISFQKCPALEDLKEFVRKCGDSVINTKRTEVVALSPVVARLLEMLRTLNRWIDEIPPLEQPSRFGNKAYRIWNEKLCTEGPALVEQVVQQNNLMMCVELAGYLEESFGNPTRIDYGTGHETTFIVFLYCLYKLEVIKESDLQSIVLRIFAGYLSVCRHLQRQYMLEPAGSHGAWSLDDYQMLVFYFGACQLHNNPQYDPDCICNVRLMGEKANEYMYFEAIHFINVTKRGLFAETSPMLYNISGATSWGKICAGMYKMWINDVLGKFPVMQHMRFGSIFSKNWTPSTNPDEREYVRVSAFSGVSMGNRNGNDNGNNNGNNNAILQGRMNGGNAMNDISQIPATFTKAPWAK